MNIGGIFCIQHNFPIYKRYDVICHEMKIEYNNFATTIWKCLEKYHAEEKLF